MIRVVVHGLDWELVYWLATCALGWALDISNLRHALRQVRAVRTGEPDERPLRASTLGHLVLHIAIAIFLLVATLTGLGLTAGALTSGLQLQFSGRTAAVIIVLLALVIPTAPTIVAALFWIWRWWTVRALRH